MKILPALALAAAALLGAGPVLAQAKVDAPRAEALSHTAGCSKCHAINAKKIGPAFSDISAQYKNDPAARQRLTEKLRQSGEDHPEQVVKERNLDVLIPWILSDPTQAPPEPAWAILSARQAGCLRCHAVERKKMGPAWSEVAARNKSRRDAQQRLMEKLKNAGDDHPEITVSDKELQIIIPWLLAH